MGNIMAGMFEKMMKIDLLVILCPPTEVLESHFEEVKRANI